MANEPLSTFAVLQLLHDLDYVTGRPLSLLFLSSSIGIWLCLLEANDHKIKEIVTCLEREKYVTCFLVPRWKEEIPYLQVTSTTKLQKISLKTGNLFYSSIKNQQERV